MRAGTWGQVSCVAASALVAIACSTDEAPTAATDGARDATGMGDGSVVEPGASPSSSSSTSSTSSSSSGGATSTEPRSLGAKRQGLATFYDGIGPKNCGLDDPANRLFAAGRMDTVYMASAACGACFRVTGELGSVVLPVIDSCPITGADVDCSVSGASLDLSPEAFDKIAPKAKGKVPITFEPVSCALMGNMKFRFKEGSSIYWTAIQVRNHRLPIAKVEYRRDDAWLEMPRVSYNYFIVASGVGPQPSGLRLRVTATDGQVVEELLPTIGSGSVVDGHVQFR